MRLTFDARTPEQLDRDCKEAFLQTYFQTRGKLHPYDWATSRTHDSGFGKPVEQQERERAPKAAKPPQEVEHVDPDKVKLRPDEVKELRTVLARIRKPATVAAPAPIETLGDKARRDAKETHDAAKEDPRIPDWKRVPTRRKITPAKAGELMQKHGIGWKAMYPDVDISLEGEEPTPEPTHDGDANPYQRLGHDLYSATGPGG